MKDILKEVVITALCAATVAVMFAAWHAIRERAASIEEWGEPGPPDGTWAMLREAREITRRAAEN